MLQTSKNPKVKEEKKAELIENSIQNTFRLEELAENMLVSMQIENDKYQYALSEIDLSEMATQIIENQNIKLKPRLERKRHVAKTITWRICIVLEFVITPTACTNLVCPVG